MSNALRRRLRRRLRTFCSLLCALGLLIAAWPLGQNAYAVWSQRALHRAWDDERDGVSGWDGDGVKRGRGSSLSRRGSAESVTPSPTHPLTPSSPWPATRLQIPGIGLDAIVLGDADAASLRQGPGRLPESGAPGQGNCVIAGHSNIYGAPFGRLNELQTGSVIRLRTPRRTWTYSVLERHLASESDLSVLAPPGEGEPPLLTLITCTVPHGAQRVVLVAALDNG